MSAMKRGRRDALVLLIVLGMLSLLSLLAVTYVAFASQSRTASVAMARRDFHETPADRLLDQAFHQVLRGTTDAQSAAWKNDILGDLYGSGTDTDTPVFLTARINDGGTVLRDNPARMSTYTYSVPFNASSPEGPELLGNNQFLKIPISWPSKTAIAVHKIEVPEQSDAWNGRVITFLAGPLANQSLRILRYVGEVPIVPGGGGGPATLDPLRGHLQYSITVDLSDLEDTLATVRYTGGGSLTRTVSQWISLAGDGRALLYEDAANLQNPYPFMVNSGVLNSHGAGIPLSGTADFATFAGTTFTNKVYDAYLANRAQSRMISNSYNISGDTDEPYDAADYQNFFLALKQQSVSGSELSDDVIPSFLRPAVINHLAKLAPNLATINPGDPGDIERFRNFIDAVQRACGRPLSYNIKNFPSGTLVSHPGFSGSNSLNFQSNAGARAPQLSIDWGKLPDPQEHAKFQAWLRWLTRGPWDVDNDGDGTADSVWVDLNFPLMTSPEGKLLKLLTAFYIEDMDGRLDVNANGNIDQASGSATGLKMADTKYAYRQTNSSNVGQWPQGIGYGAAEISLRPLVSSDTEYDTLLDQRYNLLESADPKPGKPGANDLRSMMLEHNRENKPFEIGGLPRTTFPMAVRGKSGLGLDLLGNPILVESISFQETEDDPYEASVLLGNGNDRRFTFAEYQRLARVNDIDRVGSPRRLQRTDAVAFTADSTNRDAYFARLRSMSPRNSALNLPRFALTYQYPRPGASQVPTRRVASFVEFVEAYAQNKTPALVGGAPTPYFSNAALARLFPIEFMQNLPLNLNRALGNGADNDGDGMIDEADEVINGQQAVYGTGNVNDEYIRDGSGYDLELENESGGVQSSYGGNQAKQLLARHLYCLAQLILPAEYRFPNQPDPTKVVTAPERARILAQWAVNVVDFRDPDSAMTRFAYDATPFAAKTIGGATVYWVPADGVVWGVEQTDAVITETLAFHDLRIRKKPNPPPGTEPTEQLRVPEGSLFMEFYCPRITTPVLNPVDGTALAFDGTLPPAMAGLYKVDGGELKLDLGATTPSSAGAVSPVWRVAFLKPELKPNTNTNEHLDPFTLVYENPLDTSQTTNPTKRFNYSYQLASDPATAAAAGLKWHVGNDQSPVPDPKIDRVMWFANLDPTAANVAHGLPTGLTNPTDKIFRWTDGYNMLRGGQYLVVGPRKTTYLGSKVQTGSPLHKPSNHRFEFNNTWNWLHIWNQANEPAMWANPKSTAPPTVEPPLIASAQPIDPALNASFASKVRDCVTMTAGMPVPGQNSTTTDAGATVPNDWTAAGSEIKLTHIGLNVSEPTRERYYIKPDKYLNTNDKTDPSDPENNAVSFNTLGKDAYIDMTTTPGSGTSRTPLDKSSVGYLSENKWDDPTNSKDYPEIKTERNWTAAVLQRLADPTRAYHEKYNPYITVDWMSVDLTVFSGEETLDPDKPIFLASRHKTGAMLLPNQVFSKANDTSSSPLAGNTFYSYHSELKDQASTEVTTAQTHFKYEMEAEYYAAAGATALPRSGTAEFSTFGYLNPQFVIRGTGSVQTPALNAADDDQHAYFLGSPGPNAWAVQQAPTAKTTLKAPLAPYFPNRDFTNPYELTSVPLSSPGQFFQEFSVQPLKQPNFKDVPVFSYTLDFEDLYLNLHGTPFTPPNKAATGQERSSGILLECVDVPSPWVDSWKVADPQSVQGYPINGGTTQDQLSQTMLLENYRAPYNAIPTFREPGKVNLNTVSEDTVFRGLMWNMMTPPDTSKDRLTMSIPFRNNILLERQGYAAAASVLSDPNPHLNHDHATEFGRPFTSALAPDKFPDPLQMASRSSDVLLLRRRLTDGKRLFDVAETGVFPDDDPAGKTPATWSYSTAIPLNSYTHNYSASRMANLTTDRSNVFAIRMTIGYFEYDPIPNPSTGVVPGIGAEYGAEQGRAKRHRAYYMIDRSIPVGYQMGQDLNVENCVLLRSIIE